MRAVRVLLSLVAFTLIALAMTPWVDRISPTWWVPVQALGRLWILLAVVVIVVSLFARAWLACGAGAVAIIAALDCVVTTVPAHPIQVMQAGYALFSLADTTLRNRLEVVCQSDTVHAAMSLSDT